jgi:hypothetical protein
VLHAREGRPHPLDEQRAFVTPSSHGGRPNTRFEFVNPKTTFEQLVGILDTM